MEELLVQLEANPADAEARNELFRIVHTLKGNASIVGIDELVQTAHAVEDLLDALRAGRVLATRNVIDGLFTALDAFRTILSGRSDVNSAEVIRLVNLAQASGSDTPVSAAAANSGNQATADSNCIRVDLDKLDAIMNLAAEGAVAQARLRNALEQSGA